MLQLISRSTSSGLSEDLLQQLEQVDGIDWIRLMYLYPVHFTDDLIRQIAQASMELDDADQA